MNTKIKTRSYEFKTALTVTTFVSVVIIILWGSALVFFNVFFESYQLNLVTDIASKINSEDDNLDETLESLAYENEVCILRTENYDVLSRHNSKMIGCPFDIITEYTNAMLKDFIDSDDEARRYKFVNDEDETDAVLYGINSGEEDIFIYANLEDTSIATSIFFDQMIYVTIGVVFVSIIISIYLARKITEPIIKITKKAKLLGTNQSVVFEKEGTKEVDELVDALNLAKSEIGKTDALKRDLMANVSHDLKTPLTMIKAYAEMLRDLSCDDIDKRNERLNIIIDETDRLTVLVNDILDMSKLQNKSDILKLEKFDLIKEINKIIKKYEIIKEVEDYKIIYKGPKEAIIKADKSKLNQVIYNLVNNALNYTGNNKEVYINVRKKKTGGYLVEIKDTGKGIKDSDINLIWDKYYKNDKKHKRNVVSSGIGLSIVKEIFLLHKYEYGVNTSDKGTIFYFIIK